MREDTGNAISVSLMNRNIYAVCCTESEPVSAFHGALYAARRRFFETGRTAKVNEDGLYDGMPGTLTGRVKRRGTDWEKRAGKRVLEQSFRDGRQQGVAYYEPNGALRAKVFFDRAQHWLRTEYFSPGDARQAVCSFKPDATRDAVLRFDYSPDGRTKETALFPVPYAYQTAEQSLQNASFGDRFLLVADNTGEYIYCPKPEQEQRLDFLRQTAHASVLYTMAWEVRDGVPAGASPMESLPDPVFTDMDTPAGAEAPAPEAAEPEQEVVPAVSETPEAQESGPEVSEPEPLSGDAEPLLAEETAPVADGAPEDAPAARNAEAREQEAFAALGITAEEAESARAVLGKLFAGNAPESAGEAGPVTLVRRGMETRYTGHMENGRREGFGKTETPEGMTLYQGEYKNDLQDGFGIRHYPSGAVSYVGSFREDKRDGFGVSFREDDHALHVSRWKDGVPDDFVSLYAPDGTLRYAGRIVNGRKEGAGVSVRDEDGAVFVARYEGGEMTGEGALFSPEGSLLYVGGWKDGKRNGRGTSFDSAGDVVYSGEWKDDRYLSGILYKRVGEENGGA